MFRRTLWVAGLLGLVSSPAPAAAQPGPVEDVSFRAEMALDEINRRVTGDDWMVRHDGPWLFTNDEWTNAVGVSYFPANTSYWVAVVVDDCVGCTFELRFHDEEANGYFPLNEILKVESDGSLVTATGEFESFRDMRGELYVQMLDGSDLYKTYVLLAQVR